DRRELELGDRLGRLPAVGVEQDGPVVAGQHSLRLALDDPDLAERLDRRGPRAPVLAVAILDLDRHARRGRGCAVARATQDPDPTQALGAALADQSSAR